MWWQSQMWLSIQGVVWSQEQVLLETLVSAASPAAALAPHLAHISHGSHLGCSTESFVTCPGITWASQSLPCGTTELGDTWT